jgi:aryl-alcohol dehydrogenase-like predicted oxidoreductase
MSVLELNQQDGGQVLATEAVPQNKVGITRREFVHTALAAGLALGAAPGGWAGETRGEMPYRALGRTAEKVSAIGLGGFHIGVPPEADGIRLIRTAVDRGINFMDNCWDYHRGESEARMGKALQDGYRQKVFLMTKIDGRTKTSVSQQIDESLRRLQTDHVDLMQFHEVVRMEDPDRIFAPGGGMEAMLEARKAGKIRYIGFTGHKDPLIHLRMLEVAAEHQFHFDAAQMPLNVMDARPFP